MSIKQSIHLTVDAIVFFKEDQDSYILLIKRKNQPFKNQWAFPGGFVDDHELVIEACNRELKEETNLNLGTNRLQFLNYYDAKERDPRSRTISFAFIAEADQRHQVKGKDDALEAKWFDIQNLPKLAFDHDEMIKDAIKRIENKKDSK